MALAQNVFDGGVNAIAASNFGSTVAVAGVLSLTSGTGSTSTSTGAGVVTGGLGVSQNVWVGGTLNVAGALTCTTSATVGTTLGVTGAITASSGINSTSTGITSAITGGSIVHFTVRATTAGTFCGISFVDGSTSEWAIYKQTTNTLLIRDLVNGIDQLTFNQGLSTAGSIVVNLTTASTTTTSGALQVAGGVGIVGATNIGGALGVAGTITAATGMVVSASGILVSAGGITITTGGLTSNAAGIVSAITGASITNFTCAATTAGTECGMTFRDGATAKWSIYKESTNTLNIFDSANSVSQVIFTAGVLTASFVTFNGTLAASSSTIGSVVFAGGLAIAKATVIGGVLTAGGSTVPTANTFTGNVFWGGNSATAYQAGMAGEVIESKISAYANMSSVTNTFINITSITLTAGNWDIAATAMMNQNGATTSYFTACISTTTASSSGTTLGYDLVTIDAAAATFGTTAIFTLNVSCKRVQISTSTTYYLNAEAGIGSGTPQALGSITARRAL